MEVEISIHAPREGSDEQGPGGLLHLPISIHAPREGSDAKLSASLQQIVDFYPRSPRGERLLAKVGIGRRGTISIHAPREGSDR